jgi:hypothetical protein
VTLDQSSLVLGVDVDYIYDTTRVDLPEVFRVVCYTDGGNASISGQNTFKFEGPNNDPMSGEHADLIESIKAGQTD